MANEGLMALVEAEQYLDAEREMLNADTAELNRLWQDAAYLKERARWHMAQKGLIK